MDPKEHVIDSIPAYALGILDSEEERQVNDHLRQCSQCSEELESYRLVSEQLALGVPEVRPSIRVKAAILERVQPLSPDDAGVGNKVSWVNRVTQFFRQASPVWAAVSLALIVILAAGNLILLRQVQKQAAAINHFQVVSFSATKAAPEARGILIISPDGKYGTLVVDGLPDLPGNQEYQLWLNKDNQRDSGGLFYVGYSGYGALKVESKSPLNQYTRFGITIEPKGGSPGPTGAKVLGGGSGS